MCCCLFLQWLRLLKHQLTHCNQKSKGSNGWPIPSGFVVVLSPAAQSSRTRTLGGVLTESALVTPSEMRLYRHDVVYIRYTKHAEQRKGAGGPSLELFNTAWDGHACVFSWRCYIP